MKTYYEENGANVEKWNWHHPYIEPLSDDQIFELFTENIPDIVGLSVYVWNEEVLDRIAKRIKEQYPKCIIVIGGPQQTVKTNENYFNDKPWVDIVLPSDAYGEMVLKDILDNYPIENFENISYIYYTNDKRERFKSAGTIDKRKFNWPVDIFKKQEKYILPLIKQKTEAGGFTICFYETTRGCPYKCIYCEWGGGTFTKVVQKPLDGVFKDLEWLVTVARVKGIEITDANFGILKRDVDIARKIAELKNAHGKPDTVDVDSAKNNIERVTQIKEILFEVGLLEHHKIAFQTLNEDTKKNIDRIDIPFDQQLNSVNKLNKKFGNIRVYLEQILGLPGETYETTCTQVDTIYNNNLEIGITLPIAWVLLPEAPAYTKEMREKFQIKTIKKIVEINNKIKVGRTVDQQTASNLNLVTGWVNHSVETVVGTYSYTSEDWIKMRRLYSMVVAGHSTGINTMLLTYLNTMYGTSPGALYNRIIDYAYNKKFKNKNLNRGFELENIDIHKWMDDDTKINIGIDLGEEWPFVIPAHRFYSHLILTNAQAFFEEVCTELTSHYNDDKIIDLGNYISNILLDFTYDSAVGRIFTTKYNWLEYFSNKELLTEGNYTYSINDELIATAAIDNQKLDWIGNSYFESELNYFVLISTHQAYTKESKTVTRI
jgi:radical SAM superfamily enzyme YgiQ (UPF0313 family)